MTRPQLRKLLVMSGLVACQAGGQSGEAGGALAAASAAQDARVIESDTLLSAAALAMKNGHPWRATVLLAPVVRDESRRSPAAVLLAARAAAGWGGWVEVDGLLAGQDWLDARFGGEGRELLARAFLEGGHDSAAAVTQASAAAARAPDAYTRAVRLTLLARALDRLDQRDSASATYVRAAASLPLARDWLLLRAAGAASDSAARAADYAGVHDETARARIGWTEAQLLERIGRFASAAARYAALGATLPAFRLRLAATSDSTERQRILRELLAFLGARGGTPEARLTIDVIDRAFASGGLSPPQEVLVARAAAASNQSARAIAGFQRAGAAGQLTPMDRLRYGEALAKAGRWHDAIIEFAGVGLAGPLAGEAAYQRGRASSALGSGDVARAELHDVMNRYAADTGAASSAMYLLADLLTDDGRDADAGLLFKELYRAYPTSPRASEARFRAALIAFAAADFSAAASEFDSLASANPQPEDALAARYWSGRAWATLGDDSLARVRWRDVIARDPLSYYASISARRLGDSPSAPGPAADAYPAVGAVDSAMKRLSLLHVLGLDAEVRIESDALETAADRSPDRLLATAVAFRDDGQPSRAIRLAMRALARGMRQPRVYRLVYPLLDREELTVDARARSLDPALVAGVIRQESSFNPHALSIAGARGLMQVMPQVGTQVARNLGFPLWDPILLFDPDANLQLGTAHLAGFLKRYDGIVRALAAYNAGGSRVARWSAKRGTDDPELFVERIPFTETRDYVRLVLRNAELYRALYRWP